ncbi:MAG TPA: hypothetical protein DDY13_18930, partial [Cytophagales bacterium]|nr:hypothetical protein [Cytophagales bacterium]
MQLDDNEYLVDYHNAGSINKMLQHVALHHGDLKGIVHAGALNDHIDYQQLKDSDMERLQKDASYLLKHLYSALTEVYPDGGIRLMALTKGLMQKGNKKPYLNIFQSPLWGLSKVLFNEAPTFQVQRIDMSYFPEREEVTALGNMIASTELGGGEYLLRENDFYKSFLKSEPIPTFQLEQKTLSAEGAYVVTGFRGAAFPVVQWLQKRGVRNFALISRSGSAIEEVMKRISEMRETGLKVVIVKADVSDFDSLSSALGIIRTNMPKIKGVVHAAGVIEACRINELDERGLAKVLAPKMRGAWNLHSLTLQDQLETFLMFSSASSLIGLSGQGSYVAANTFIDQMAHFRNKLNLSATAINWGVISDVGMVADEVELERYARAQGFIPFKMQEAVEVLDKIFDMQPIQKGIMQMDIETAAAYYDQLADTGFFENLLQTREADEANGEQFDMGSYVGKDEALDAIRSLVTAKVASITKASSSMITGSMTFKNLGVDSLMAIQLRNQLEAVFNTKLAVTNFWKHPSITDFANFLYKKLEETVSIEAEHDNVSEVKEGNWFVKPSPNPNANIKLFCFHDAGGSSSLYQGWAELLDDNIELIAVELPGRGSRMAEQTLENMSDLADKLSGLIEAEAGQKPFVFFGHSMGGAVLLEVTRKLRDYGLPFPLQLFTSSTPALDAYNHQDVAYEISEEELISRFPHLSSENIEDEELRQLFIKIIRADLK